MNKRERVTAAFRGREVDHVPVCMWQHVGPEYWGDDDRFAAVQAKFLHDTDVDFMKLSGDKYFGWPAPALAGIEKAEDLYRVRPLGAYDGYLTVELRDSRFGLLRRLETDVRAEPLSASCVLREDFSALLPDAETRRRVFCEYRLEVDGQVISRGTTLFAKPKHPDLPGVKYMAEVTERADDFDINLTADGFSYYTELDFHEWDAVFSDNYFDITRPEGVTVSVSRRFLPAGVTCDEVRAALTIRSVRDSYSPRED